MESTRTVPRMRRNLAKMWTLSWDTYCQWRQVLVSIRGQFITFWARSRWVSAKPMSLFDHEWQMIYYLSVDTIQMDHVETTHTHRPYGGPPLHPTHPYPTILTHHCPLQLLPTHTTYHSYPPLPTPTPTYHYPTPTPPPGSISISTYLCLDPVSVAGNV